MNWQGHEVWIQALQLLLVGQQGPGRAGLRGLGRAGLRGMAPTSCLTYPWVWWDDLHPVLGRVTAEMGLIQCEFPSWNGLW